MTGRAKFTAGLLVAAALLAAGCGGAGGSGGGDRLTLVAYSTPREAYEQLIPAFQKTGAGTRGPPSPSRTGPRATRAAPSRTAWPPTWSPSPSSPT